jgi:hypothetical protein
MVDEKILQKKSRWKRVSDVPEFPVKNFGDLREGIKTRRYSLILDRTLVSQLAVIFGGRLGGLVYMLLRTLMIALAVGLIFAVRAGYLLSIWGVLISLIVLGLSSRLRWLVGAVVILTPIGLVGAIARKHYMLASLFVGILTPLMLIWLTNRTNRLLVRRAALGSEVSFLYMYERGVVALMDNDSKQVYYCRDSARGTEFS